jgi:hypothetical protein
VGKISTNIFWGIGSNPSVFYYGSSPGSKGKISQKPTGDLSTNVPFTEIFITVTVTTVCWKE